MAINTVQRIKHYIDFKGIKVSVFERQIGMSNGSFASQLKNNKTIGVDKLENILKKYTDINLEWLLTGVGSMLKLDEFKEEKIQEKAINYKDLAEARKETIESLKKEIMYLEEKIESYKKLDYHINKQSCK